MSFNSIHFMCFFPVVVLIYFLIPQKVKYIWLLISSYYFYMSWNPRYAILIAVSTIVTYLSGILIDKAEKYGAKKIWVALSFVINLAILFYFKYFDFFIDNLNRVITKFGVTAVTKPFDVLLPVGISFYTFQALSYTMDVYRGELKPEKNILKYALFVSFFPQLVAGPIERSKNLIHQISEEHKFDSNRVRHGLLLMLWGFFMKLILADRLSVIVDEIFNNYERYGGYHVILAVVFFGFQIYCDFGSYSNIAIGAAQVMGFDLMKNFEQPYLAVNVADFWRRWHISLTSWFRDYMYIPLGGNRRGKIRKYINIFIVFAVSGLWHGAAWSYIIWGSLNGIFQITGDLLRPLTKKIDQFLNHDKNTLSKRIRQSVITFCLVDFAWLFFRAPSLGVALHMIKSIKGSLNPWIFFDGRLYELGLDAKDFRVMIVGMLVLFAADLINEKGISIRTYIEEQEIWFRWLFYIGAILFVLIYGVYGPMYSTSDFIYFQF